MPRKGVITSLTAVLLLSACGGGEDRWAPQPHTAPVSITPAAAIEAAGDGPITVHPSALPKPDRAAEVPLRVRETGGGTADWNWARFSVHRNGTEVERIELGADALRASGLGTINAGRSATHTLVFRFYTFPVESVTVTLGFTDLKDARQISVEIPSSSFGGIVVTRVPL